MAMDDIDMFDLDEPSRMPVKIPRFLPTKFKPKPKAKLEASKAVKVKREEEAKKEGKGQEFEPSVMNGTAKSASEPSDVRMEVLDVRGEQEEEETKVAMEVDSREDRVIREIDVFVTPPPIDDNTKLYLLQYPLRPCWRPYEFDEQCEVRVKPASGEVEVDLVLDIDSPNYDNQADDSVKTAKQTLTSLWKPPRTTGYAVGVLIGDKLHLNPLHAVVQLRPSMEHLKYGGSNKKTNTGTEASIKSEEHNEDPILLPKKQSWVPLKYHGSESGFRSKYLQRMVAKEGSPIQFSMGLYDYLNSLCPSSFSSDGVKGPSKRLLSLPLEDRIKTWLREGPPVHRFNALKHLAPGDSANDVLQVLKRHARLVQGLWVPKSSLVFEGGQGVEVLARDYILLLFSKSSIIKCSQVEFSRLAKSMKAILKILAIERPSFKDWKLKEPTDTSFITLYPDIVSEQEQLWKETEEQVTSTIYGSGRSGLLAKNFMKPSLPNKPGTSINSDKGAARLANATTSRRMTMSNETREALLKALKRLFQTDSVCSFQHVCQGLRDLAVSQQHSSKADVRAVVLAAHALETPKEDLEALISQVATNIHGIYVSKEGENPEYNLFRNVVIDLFSAKGPKARLRKADFTEAAKISLKREITSNEYSKVLHELCVNKAGGWVLRSGDGNPK